MVETKPKSVIQVCSRLARIVMRVVWPYAVRFSSDTTLTGRVPSMGTVHSTVTATFTVTVTARSQHGHSTVTAWSQHNDSDPPPPPPPPPPQPQPPTWAICLCVRDPKKIFGGRGTLGTFGCRGAFDGFDGARNKLNDGRGEATVAAVAVDRCRFGFLAWA